VNILEEPLEHLGDYSEVPQPFALRPLLQDLRLPAFLLRTKGLEKQNWFAHHVLPLLPVGLPVMVKEGGHLSCGESFFSKILGKKFPMPRYCARNRNDHSAGSPRGDRPFPD